MLDAVERARGNGQRLELKVHGEGGGIKVVRLVSPKHKKWRLEEKLCCLSQPMKRYSGDPASRREHGKTQVTRTLSALVGLAYVTMSLVP